MFWRVVLISSPTACAEAGIEAAFAWNAEEAAKSKRELIMLYGAGILDMEWKHAQWVALWEARNGSWRATLH